MKYSIALVLLIESINNVNGFISSRLPNTMGLQALGARGVSGGGGNKNNPLDDWLDGNKEVSGERADNRLPISFSNRDNKEKSSSGVAKRDNPYLELITQVPPAEIMFRFTTTTSSRV